jgi:hypothetical protein
MHLVQSNVLFRSCSSECISPWSAFKAIGLCTADDNLLVKYVLFNGSTVDWWASPNAENSTWISIGLYKSLSEFDASLAYDFVITVRGEVSDLCPATVFFQSQDACEYAMHGRSGDFQCCPHGITQPQGPPSECCVDQLSQSPYR